MDQFNIRFIGILIHRHHRSCYVIRQINNRFVPNFPADETLHKGSKFTHLSRFAHGCIFVPGCNIYIRGAFGKFEQLSCGSYNIYSKTKKKHTYFNFKVSSIIVVKTKMMH